MPWIKQVNESEATGKLADLYQQLGGSEHKLTDWAYNWSHKGLELKEPKGFYPWVPSTLQYYQIPTNLIKHLKAVFGY